MQSTFIRRSIVIEAGAFDLDFETCHSISFLRFLLTAHRLGDHGRIVPEYWSTFRRGHENQAHRRSALQYLPYSKERIKACKKYSHEYSDILSPRNKRRLLSFGYFRETMARIKHQEGILFLLTPFIKLIWYSGDWGARVRYFIEKRVYPVYDELRRGQ